MLAPLLALLASTCWGVADFLGGALSRRLPAAVVTAGAQVAAVAAAAVAVLVAGAPPVGRYLGWGLAGGVANTLALVVFYRALAIGTMSVVAPIAGTGLVVPVVAGLAAGERPSGAQLAGIALAAAGVVLASGPELRGEGTSRRSVGYAAGAAIGFGTTLVLTAEGSEVDVATTLLASFAVAALVAGGWVVVTGQARGLPLRDVPQTGLIGLLNLGAVGLYGIASRSALVSVVAVLASLYPVVTVLLARRVYHERLRRVQVAGVSAALAGVVLMAAG